MESEEESSLDQADLRHAKATQEATFARLSRHSKRPEVITTPGPYRNGTASPFRDRRVLMTMRSNTGKRANPITEVKTCAPDVPPGSCERAYKFTQPKSFSATFSLEPRFGWKALKSVAPCNAVKSQFDIEKAWKATQAKSYTVNFNLATSSTSFPKDPLLLKGTTGPAPGYYSSESHTLSHLMDKSQGGVISKDPRDMKWTIHEESPGPIYNPNYKAVEAVQASTHFSTSAHGKKPAKCETSGTFKYADGSAAALSSLSTSRRSPAPVFSTRPSASEMPLPFDTSNYCNSGTMRTQLKGPAGENARLEAERMKEKKKRYWSTRLHRTGSACAKSRPVSAVVPIKGPEGGGGGGGGGGGARPSTAPAAALSAQRLQRLHKNPLQSVMRIAERGYEIGAIMSAVLRTKNDAEGDSPGSPEEVQG